MDSASSISAGVEINILYNSTVLTFTAGRATPASAGVLGVYQCGRTT